MATKKCTKCGNEKPLSGFCRRATSTDGRMSWCRICNNEQRRQWEAANPNKCRAGNYYRENAERIRQTHLKYKYGMTAADYQQRRTRQNDMCALCGRPETREVRGRVIKLAVDHDHETGHIRGLLCGRCNQALGLLRDDPALCEAAAAYLRQ